MNKNDFWKIIEPIFDKAEEGEVGIIGTSLGYIPKGTCIGAEIDYKKYGLDFLSMLSLLEELNRDGKIVLEDTNNMGYSFVKNN